MLFRSLILIVGSAVEMSYDWAKMLVYEATSSPAPPDGGKKKKKKGGDKKGKRAENRAEVAAGGDPPNSPPPRRNQEAALDYTGLDKALDTTVHHQSEWTFVRVRVPESPNAPFNFTIDRGNGAQPQEAGVLSVSRETGEALRWTPFSAQTLGHQVDELLRYIHTGEVLGAAGQTFAAIVTAGAGGASRYPQAESHPMARSACSWSWVSTPSATTRRSSMSARLRRAETMAVSSRFTESPATKDRSIFSVSAA